MADRRPAGQLRVGMRILISGDPFDVVGFALHDRTVVLSDRGHPQRDPVVLEAEDLVDVVGWWRPLPGHTEEVALDG